MNTTVSIHKEDVFFLFLIFFKITLPMYLVSTHSPSPRHVKTEEMDITSVERECTILNALRLKEKGKRKE